MSPILLLFVHNYRQPNCIQFLYIVFRENATHGIARLMAHSEKKVARWERERENAKRIRSHRPFQRNIAGAKNSLCMEMCVGSFTLFRKSPSSKIISFCSNIFGIIKKSKAPYRLLKSAVHTCASQSTFAYLSTICAFFVVFVGRQNMLKQNNFAARIIKTKKKYSPSPDAIQHYYVNIAVHEALRTENLEREYEFDEPTCTADASRKLCRLELAQKIFTYCSTKSTRR